MQITPKSCNYFIPILLLAFITFCDKAEAHGANIAYRQQKALEIEAKYDDGTPMKNAQVIIYAPNDPATPYLKGTTDDQGRFVFVPDPSIVGNWDVKVRQSGHGAIISVPFTDNTQAVPDNQQPLSNNSGYTTGQKLMMAATGVWGFVGTALYFSRRKTQH